MKKYMTNYLKRYVVGGNFFTNENSGTLKMY